MLQRIEIGLLLGFLLLPVSLAAAPPELADLSAWLDSDRGKPPLVVIDQRIPPSIYRPGTAVSALPPWWHQPEWLLPPIIQLGERGPLGQGGIRFIPPPAGIQLLTPRGPIIQEEEEAQLGLDR